MDHVVFTKFFDQNKTSKEKPSKSSSSSFGRIQALLEFTGLATKILAKLEVKIQ